MAAVRHFTSFFQIWILLQSSIAAFASSEDQCRTVFTRSPEVRKILSESGPHETVALMAEILAPTGFDLVGYFAKHGINCGVSVGREGVGGGARLAMNTYSHFVVLELTPDLLEKFYREASFEEVEVIGVYPHNMLSIIQFVERTQRVNRKRKRN